MTVQRKYDTSQPAGYCAYCGAPLNAFYYFCLRCATPYKPLESVAPGSLPRPLGDEERIRLMAPHVWTIFGVFALVAVVSGLIGYGLFGEHSLAGVFVVATLGIFITTCVFASLYWRSLLGQFKTFGFNRWEAWAGLGILAPFSASTGAITPSSRISSASLTPNSPTACKSSPTPPRSSSSASSPP